MMLFELLAWHAVADFPLQGDYLAKAKHHKNGVNGASWMWALGCHAIIHAVGVAWLLGSPVFGAVEFVTHAATDWAKCDGRISFNVDQGVHAVLKVAYVVLIALGWG